jgi:oxygen-independent coproporphyrinogen-3 oxidase
MTDLIAKYTIPAPRYTSYPTVPYWNPGPPDTDSWKRSIQVAGRNAGGISLYIHLPFCESLCTYCGCNTRITRNHQVEQPYIDALLLEWRMYRALLPEAPVIRELHLGGGTPTFFTPENLGKLVGGILDGCMVPDDAAFSIEGHPTNTTREHLEVLVGYSFRRLSLGIQDFDPRVQEIINRRQTVQDVETVTRHARDLGYASINYDLIYGLPLQTPGGLQRTIWKTLRLRPDRIAFYSYAHVPWMKPGQRRFTEADLPSAELKRELQGIGRELFKDAGYREVGMDHFALPSDPLFAAEAGGSLHRNFMGYTDLRTPLLIGLGVSSISDSGTAFAQNEKRLEAYLAAVRAETLPIVKLHELSAEDLLIREHILNLMCKSETSWPGASGLESRLLLKACERLLPLERDGLVQLGSQTITVTPLGRRFLRNICMMLDVYLWENNSDGQRFSLAG